MEGKRLIRGEDSLDAVLVNLEGESKSMDTCSVCGIVLDYQEEGRLYELPGEIYLGRTKLSQVEAVSYTHLDVYKRQGLLYDKRILSRLCFSGRNYTAHEGFIWRE